MAQFELLVRRKMGTCERREKHGSGQTNQPAETHKPGKKKALEVKSEVLGFSHIYENPISSPNSLVQ